MATMATYERLQAQGKIGPRDENGHMRPWQEFPKAVRDASGTVVIVNSAREELAVAAKVADSTNAAADADPIIAERNRLARENDELRAKLQLLQQEGTKSATVAIAPAPISPPAPTPDPEPAPPEAGLPEGAKLGTPVIKRAN